MSEFLRIFTDYTRRGHKDRTPRFKDDPAWLKFTKATDYTITSADKVVIQVIGVFDTVGALGVPDIHTFAKKFDMSNWRKDFEFLDVKLRSSKYSIDSTCFISSNIN